MAEHKYLTTQSPSLTIKLGGKRVQAVNGILHLDANQAAELDNLIKTQPGIRGQVRKVDMDEVAKRALEAKKNFIPAAIKGPVTSGTSQAQKLREASAANRPEQITGVQNPINTAEKEEKKLDVQTVDVTKPSDPAPAKPLVPPTGLAAKIAAAKAAEAEAGKKAE